MNTTTIRLGTRTLFMVSLLALPAGTLACGAAPGTAEDGADPDTSPADPAEKPGLAAPEAGDDDAGPGEEPTGRLVEPPAPAPAPSAEGPHHRLLPQ